MQVTAVISTLRINHIDRTPSAAMQMAAAGAHVVVETTGVGTVTGGVVAPVIKVCANPKACSLLADDLDVDARAPS